MILLHSTNHQPDARLANLLWFVMPCLAPIQVHADVPMMSQDANSVQLLSSGVSELTYLTKKLHVMPAASLHLMIWHYVA